MMRLYYYYYYCCCCCYCYYYLLNYYSGVFYQPGTTDNGPRIVREYMRRLLSSSLNQE